MTIEQEEKILENYITSKNQLYILAKKENTPKGETFTKADKKALADAGMKVGKVNSTLNKHFKEVGATMSKEWASRAGSRGQAVLAAYK